MRSSRLLLLFVCIGLLAPASAAAAGVSVQAAPELPAGASFAGAVSPERQLDLYVALEPRDPAALESFAEEVATPGSPVYGEHLSVAQFAARFGATPAQVSTVRSALAAQGLEVGAPSANSLSLPVTATAGEAEAAFGTAISRVETADGRLAFANRGAPRVAAAAAPYIQGILGLDDLRESHRSDAPADVSPLAPTASGTAATGSSAPAPAATTSVFTGGPQPCAEAIKAGEEATGYTADEFAAAYGLSGFYAAGNFGAGQTVALLELEPFFTKDINDFQNCYGTHVPITMETVGKAPADEGEDGEAAMDIENVLSLAPGARIVVYQSANDSGAEAAIISAYVSQNVAKVMSSSWGLCEKFTQESEPTAMATINTLLQEAAAQGQSFFAAAGDFGSTDCYEEGSKSPDKSLAVDYPPSDPFATAVGGTRMEEPTGAATDYLWDEAPKWGAGGGGLSEYFAMPAYQRNAAAGLGVVDALSSGTPCGVAAEYCRQVPDVSADAAVESGWVIHAEGAWEVNGGTSAAAPFWAAFTALTNASSACGGHTVGFANPALYAVGGTSYATAFRDVTGPLAGGRPTTNRFDEAEPYPAKAGYDMASGLGVPNGTALAASLCAIANPPAPPASPTAPVAPKTAPAAPTPAKVTGARFANVLKGKPRLTFALSARAGAKLTNLSVQVPPALDTAADPETLAKGIVIRSAAGAKLKFEATSTPGTIRIKLKSPQPSVKLKIAFPALETTEKLAAHIREGVTKKLGIVLTTRESGGTGARLSLTVGV